MGQTIANLPCKQCGSRDNLKVYIDEKGRKQSQCKTPNCPGDNSQTNFVTVNSTSVQQHSISQASTPLVGYFKEIRGLTIETCKHYNYMVLMIDGIESRICDYGNGIQKIKSNNKKDQFWIGYDREKRGFFGEQLWDYTKPLVITTGEEDAMAVYQVMEGQVNASSIHAGDESAAELIELKQDLLVKFPKVILCFDTDKSGQTALKAIKPYFCRMYIANLGQFKDANDALMAQFQDLIKNAILQAKELPPKGVTLWSNISKKDLMKGEEFGIPIKYPVLNEFIRGLKPGKTILIGGGTGVGKSSFVKELMLPIMLENKYKIAHIFLEEPQKETYYSYISLINNKPRYLVQENPDEIEISKGLSFIKNDNNLSLDHFGSLDSKDLFNTLRYLAKIQKCDIIVLDHLSIVISGMESSREGERKDIDRLMTELKMLNVESGVRFIVVSHLRKEQGLSFEEGALVTLDSFRGSGSLKQLSDVVIGLEANQRDVLRRNQLQVVILKNRLTGKLGNVDMLYYMEDTGRLQTLDQIFKKEDTDK
jgi:twinkle protein